MTHPNPIHQPFCPDGCKLPAETVRIDGLIRWQKAQNGTLGRLEQKMDHIQDKIDTLHYWIMGTLATALIACLGFVFSLLQHAPTK